MSKFLDGNKTSSFGQWLQIITAFLRIYRDSGSAQKRRTGRGSLQVLGPQWGMGATGIQGLHKTMGAQSFLGPPKFFRRASTPALQSTVVLLAGINFPTLQSHQWYCRGLKWTGKMCSSGGLCFTKTTCSFDIKPLACTTGPCNISWAAQPQTC